jgi:hypothetical protein
LYQNNNQGLDLQFGDVLHNAGIRNSTRARCVLKTCNCRSHFFQASVSPPIAPSCVCVVSAHMPLKKKAKDNGSHARFTPFARGAIAALSLVAWWSAVDVACEITKSDGTAPTAAAVVQAVQLAEANGGLKWDGELQGSSGAPRKTPTRWTRRSPS